MSFDLLSGGANDDTLFSVDGRGTDQDFGGDGFDTATMDSTDAFGDDIEQRIVAAPAK